MALSITAFARILLSALIWLQAIIIAPQNATRKQPKNTARETETDLFETMNATNAAQNGVRFNIAAVMMGCALLRPISNNTRPDTPTRNTAASLGRFRTSSSMAAKSRRLSVRAISSGTENSNAHWVKPIKSIELRVRAAGAEKGGWSARRIAVATAYEVPRR